MVTRQGGARAPVVSDKNALARRLVVAALVLARKWLLPRVHAHVLLQIACAFALVSALIALVCRDDGYRGRHLVSLLSLELLFFALS